MRIFAFEFIKKSLNMNEIHFVFRKKNAQFKLKAQIGPFKVNTKGNDKEVENLLILMKFKSSIDWTYEHL